MVAHTVQVGLDKNGNGELDPDRSNLIYNHQDGKDGKAGTTSATGAKGDDKGETVPQAYWHAKGR